MKKILFLVLLSVGCKSNTIVGDNFVIYKVEKYDYGTSWFSAKGIICKTNIDLLEASDELKIGDTITLDWVHYIPFRHKHGSYRDTIGFICTLLDSEASKKEKYLRYRNSVLENRTKSPNDTITIKTYMYYGFQ